MDLLLLSLIYFIFDGPVVAQWLGKLFVLRRAGLAWTSRTRSGWEE